MSNTQRGKLRSIERVTNQKIEIADWPTADEINSKRTARFKDQITKTLADRDVTFFENLIREHAEETGASIEKIAGALADIVQGGRAFLVKDRPRSEPRDRRENRRDDFDSFDGGDPRNSHSSSDERSPRRLGPVRPGMHRFRVEVGLVDGVKPGNLVGAIANEAGIQSEFIGPINIQHNFTTVDLPEGMPQDIFETLHNVWVMGKQLRISRDMGDPRGNFKGKSPRSQHGPKGKPGKRKPGKRKAGKHAPARKDAAR